MPPVSDISLLSAANSQRLTGSNSSHGGSIGVSLGFGQNGFGLSVDASADSAHGAENGSGTSQQITTTDSGRNLTINAGGDTTLQGAQANAQHISLATGNNLTLSSEQHTDHFHSSQYSSSAGVSIPVYGYKTGSASVSASRDKINSDYNSVTQQTGLFAGAGGFDIHTGNHTQLNGAVIASTADKSKNQLDTATLGFSNIQNAAAYDVQHQGVSLSSGNPLSAAMSAAGSLAGANHSDSAASTTYAAVSDGNIIIRDKAHQKQSVSELSRDTDHAANGLSPIFNKQNELKRLQTVQLLSDIGSQVSDIALTEGKIRAAQQAKTQTENASATERRRVRNKLTAEANARAAKTGKPAAAVSEADITQKIYTEHYNQALTDSGFGTGGKYQQAITAATAAIQGLITNSPGAALSGAAAPYLATEIKRLTTDEHEHQNKPAALLAHAIVNAALAAASGEGKQGAIAAAAGAVTGEATAIIASQAFHKPVSELSEEEKQTVSTLATLASGLAGALFTDSGTGAVTAAQAGKITAENNALTNRLEQEKIQELADQGVATEEELNAAACALLHCSEEFVEGTAEKAYYKQLEETGSRPEYAALREKLAGEHYIIQYKYGKQLFTNSLPLFGYDKFRSITDSVNYADNQYQIGTRLLGALQTAGGAAAVVGGAASCGVSFGTGCILGGAITTFGADNLIAGSNTLVSGRPQKTVGADILEKLGVPAEYSELVYAVTGLTASSAQLMLQSAKTGKILTVNVAGDGRITKSIPKSHAETAIKPRVNGDKSYPQPDSVTVPNGEFNASSLPYAAENALNPAKFAEFRNRIANARAQLPSRIRESGNVAVADININAEGIPKTMAASSRVDEASRGFVGEGSKNFKYETLPNKEGAYILRSADSEYKILDNLADKLGNQTSAKGNVIIFTERPACNSCLEAANQFRQKYPNIDVKIFDNNGITLIPEKKK